MGRELRLNLTGQSGYPWRRLCEGTLFCGDVASREKMSKYVGCSTRDGAEVSRLLIPVAQGCCALVADDGSRIHLSVDTVASIPLFYRVDRDAVYVSDSALSIASGEVDADRLHEYETIMYTLLEDTIDPRVRQVQAGQSVCIDLVSGKVETHDAWTYARDAAFEDPDLRELDDLFLRSVGYAVADQGALPIVVPLSAGYDSRAIVYALKTLGVEDVICFSYGKTMSAEAKVSRDIACALGYPWHFVTYSAGKMSDYLVGFYSAHALDYFHLGRIPCVQTALAFHELRRTGVVPGGALVLPGHTGLFWKGDVPSQIVSGGAYGGEDLLEYLRGTHIRYAGAREGGESLDARLISAANHFGYGDTQGFVAAVNFFNWRERQTKFIVNDTWYISAEGCRFGLPLCNYLFADWCRHLGLRSVVGKRLCKEYASTYVNPVCGLPAESPGSEVGTSRILRRLGSRLARSVPARPVKLALHLRGDDPLGLSDCVSRGAVVRDMLMTGYAPDINSLCRDRLMSEFDKRTRDGR